MKLRDYQQRVIDDVRTTLAEQKRQQREKISAVIESPTGSGKTVLAAFMCKSAVKRGGSVAFICHRKELIEQTAGTFDAAGISYGYIAAGHPRSPNKVQLCSVGTLANRVQKIDAPTVVIWDECHHIAAGSWAKIFDAWPTATHVGLSATPQRLDGTGLGHWFNAIVHGSPVAELMADGYLSTYECYAAGVPDLSAVKRVKGGEFQKKSLAEVLGQGEIMGDIPQKWLKYAEGRKTIGFAVSVKHSLEICEQFRAAGIEARHLDANSKRGDRRWTLQQFARGVFPVLMNVDLFSEGFDLAANSGIDCTVEAGLFCRPTASIGLHLQQLGRILRPKVQPAIALDFAGNCLRLGLPDEPREWTLEDREKKQGSDCPTTVKMCPKCFGVASIACRACPYCGEVYPFAGREVEEVSGDLHQLDTGMDARMRKAKLRQEVGRAKSIDALRSIGEARGYHEGWARQVMQARVRSRGPVQRRL